MELYIMRHGIAVESFEWPGDDASRPLTGEGVARTRQVLHRLFEQKRLEVAEIWSSPLVRAWQTAAVAGEILSLKPRPVEPLGCGGSPVALERLLAPYAEASRGVMLVGHEPDCGLLVARLTGEAACPFKKAGLACLSGAPRAGGMRLMWRLSPRDVLKEGRR